jgi:hypothetical protein
VVFAVSPTPPHTCSYWGVQFILDTTTAGGKNDYALLLVAKATGALVDVWYHDSNAPGTDQTNGCTVATMSVADSSGFSN